MRWPAWLRRPNSEEIHTIYEMGREATALTWNEALAKAIEIVLHAPVRESGIPKLRQILARKIEALRRTT